MNTTGTLFRLTSFGESHGKAMGGIIDGCPAGIPIDLDVVQQELNRRRPGQSALVSPRNEADEVRFLSGLMDGLTLGSPIAFLIENRDSISADYDQLKEVFRPSHADITYEKKYGIRDHRGGGRSSARETVNWVVAGAIARQILAKIDIQIVAWVDQIETERFIGEVEANKIDESAVRCPDPATTSKMLELIEDARRSGDTLGGCISCRVSGVPAGLGEPVFDKLHASLGKLMLSINAVKGVEFGSGFQAASMRGSEHNDLFLPSGQTKSNNAGGVLGGISNGMPLQFRLAFKPVATLMKEQEMLHKDGSSRQVKGKGRHDVCVVPRAVPVVESLAAICLLDFCLLAGIRFQA